MRGKTYGRISQDEKGERMRLEDMSFTDYLIAEGELHERQRKERMKQAEFEKYAKEHNLFVCSTDMIEQIREEIADEKMDIDLDIGQEIHYNKAIDDVLEIIDKYMKGERKWLTQDRSMRNMQGSARS